MILPPEAELTLGHTTLGHTNPDQLWRLNRSIATQNPAAGAPGDTVPVALLHCEFRLGVQSEAPDVRFLVGHVFGSPDAALLVSLLPELVHGRTGAKHSPHPDH